MVDYHPDVPRDFTDMVNGYESTIKRLRAERDEARALLVRVNDHTGFSVFSDPLPVEVLHYVAAHCE